MGRVERNIFTVELGWDETTLVAVLGGSLTRLEVFWDKPLPGRVESSLSSFRFQIQST